MLNKTRSCFVIMLFFNLFIHLDNVLADQDGGQEARYRAVDREMDCVERHPQGITWDDVCFLNSGEDSRDYQGDWNRMQMSSDRSELTKQQQFEFGTEVSHIRYSEKNGGVNTKGMAYGIFGVYNHRLPVDNLAASIINVLHVDVHFNYNLVDHTGQWVADNVNDYIVEPRVWIGKDIIAIENFRVTPYTGVGYRYVFDDIGGKSSVNGLGTFDSRSQFLYIPMGAELAMLPATGWEVRLAGEYDYFVRGWVTYKYSQAEGFGPDITNHQKKGYGMRGSVDIIKKGENVNLSVAPYVRYWKVKESDIQGDIESFVPENKSTEIGARLGVQF